MAEVKKIATRESYGATLATTKLDIFFTGKAAHAGAVPEKGANALLAAATAVLNLQAIPRSSEGDTRINVGTFRGGTGRNVIPAEAVLAIETRGGTAQLNEYMEREAQRVCRVFCGLPHLLKDTAKGA